MLPSQYVSLVIIGRRYIWIQIHESLMAVKFGRWI